MNVVVEQDLTRGGAPVLRVSSDIEDSEEEPLCYLSVTKLVCGAKGDVTHTSNTFVGLRYYDIDNIVTALNFVKGLMDATGRV